MEILAQDEVDHARHRVSAIDRGGAVGQDFNPVDGGGRDHREVDEVPDCRGGSKTSAVHQREGRAGAEPAQVGARRIGIVPLGIAIIRKPARGKFCRAAAEILRQGAQELLRRRQPGSEDVVAREDLKWRALRRDPAQARAGDRHPVNPEVCVLLRLCALIRLRLHGLRHRLSPACIFRPVIRSARVPADNISARPGDGLEARAF